VCDAGTCDSLESQLIAQVGKSVWATESTTSDSDHDPAAETSSAQAAIGSPDEA
jgi:hypothetical protein